jgi:hypothetical protein
MRSKFFPSAALLTAALLCRAVGDIVVPGANGTDGVLVVSTDTVIDLSKAVTAAWNSDNSANVGKGVYDASKWAVVFKYSDVNILSNATVTFKNHPSRAPVVWLVSGNVKIHGQVILDGEKLQKAPRHAEPGPGGFRGGQGNYGAQLNAGSGFGVGGGRSQEGGNYGSIPAKPPAYGNPSILQLIGGAGGGGNKSTFRDLRRGGGAGGGAILIAATQTIQVDGRISADGGQGQLGDGNSDDTGSYGGIGAGSGGAIRLVCDTVQGRGVVSAVGGKTDGKAAEGGFGRLRVERFQNVNLNPGVISFGPDPSVVTLTQGSEAMIWPPAGAPEVRITSIGGQSVSLDPRAGFGAFGPDVALPVTSTSFVTVETKNVEPASQVIVRVTPKSNTDFIEANAAIVSSTNGAIQWRAGVDVTVGYSAVQVRVVRP